MAEKVRGIPFDANEVILPDGTAGYDNVLYSKDFAEWIQTYFKNGVLVSGGALISSELRVDQVDETTVQVKPGNMVVNGRTAFITEPINLSISKGGVDLKRFDRIIVELNLDTLNSFRLIVLKGEMAAVPVEPQLTKTDKIYQMSLATVKVDQAGIYEITDERADENLCGISQVLIGVRPPLPVTGDDASNIHYDNSISLLESTTVQFAIDELAEQIKTTDEKTISTDQKVVLKKDGWTESNTQVVSVPGLKVGMKVPIIDVVANTRDQDKQWARIWKATVEADQLTFYCSEPTEIDLTVIVKTIV